MEDRSQCVVLTVRLSPALSARLTDFAHEQRTTRSELVRELIDRALAAGPASPDRLEKSVRFLHVAVDALLRYHPEKGIRDEVLRIQRAVINQQGTPTAGEGRA